MWTIDVDTGVVSVPSTGKRYEAEHSKITGRAGMYKFFPAESVIRTFAKTATAVTDCESCISKRAVQNSKLKHIIQPISDIKHNH